MAESFTVDSRLIEGARKSESAMVGQGVLDDGEPIIVIVAVGASAGLLKRYARAGMLKLDISDVASGEEGQ